MFDDLIDWEGKLLKGLSDFTTPQVPNLPQGLQADDRWICASAMQKAIRRNQVPMALKSAFSLRCLKPEQLWSRLRVIVQEDIGAANPFLMGQVLWVAGKKVWRRDHGGEDKILAYLITQMCSSPKSRVANDLLCLANYHSAYKKSCVALADYSVRQLEEVLLKPDTSIVLRAIAAWYIAGTNSRSIFNMLERRGTPRALNSIYEYMECPAWLLDIMRLSLGRGEGHGITMGLAWLHQESANKVHFKDECLEPSIIIGEWHSENYDVHTRSGKQSYSLFLKQNPEIKTFLNMYFKGKNHNAIIGNIVFGIEGHSMNNRISYPAENKLTATALESYVDEFYIGEIKTELEGMIREKFNDIHQCRKWNCNN